MHAFPVHFLQILLFMFKLIYSHCGIPIWDLFVYSLLCVCGIAETWIPYTDFDLLKSHFCTGTNYWNVSCKFDDMLQNFCVFDNRLRFKNPLSSLVIWQKLHSSSFFLLKNRRYAFFIMFTQRVKYKNPKHDKAPF